MRIVEQPTAGHCTHCGKKLNKKRAEWLELDVDADRWVTCGTVPSGHESFGCFEFGPTCVGIVRAGATPGLW